MGLAGWRGGRKFASCSCPYGVGSAFGREGVSPGNGLWADRDGGVHPGWAGWGEGLHGGWSATSPLIRMGEADQGWS